MAQNLNNVMYGRVQDFLIAESSGSIADIEVTDLKTGTVNVTEEIKREVTELADGQEIAEEFGRKVVVEVIYDELVEADISAATGSTFFQVETSKQKLEITDADYIVAHIDGVRTKITVEKSVSTGLPYTIISI